MLHIKLMGVERRATCKHILCPYTHPRPLGLGQKVKTFFLNVVMLNIKLKELKFRPTLTDTCKYTQQNETHTVQLVEL